MKIIIITIFIYFYCFGLVYSQQNNSDKFNINIDKYIIDYSIKYIWHDDSLATKKGRFNVTEYLVSTQYFVNDSLSKIVQILGAPYRILDLDSVTVGYVYISLARLYSDGSVLNVEIFQVNLGLDNIVTGLHRYSLDSRDDFIEYNRKR